MKKYLFLFLWLFIAALNFNLILKPLNLVTGGTQGLTLLIKNIIDIRPSIIILIINVITLILSYFILPKNATYGALVSSFLYPLSVRISSFIPEINFITNHIFISSILAGIVCGITGGFIYKLGFSSGGVSTINLIVNKYLNIKVSMSNFIVNFILIILGCFSFGIIKGIYSTIVIIVSSILIDIIFKKNKSY